MSIAKNLILCLLSFACLMAENGFGAESVNAGFLYSDCELTLDLGHRTEILGPLYYSEDKESQHTWAIPPLTFAHVEDKSIGYKEIDFIYPFLTYDRFGSEYRWEFFQLFSFAGGTNQDDSGTHRFTIFPLYFQQRSTDPTQNYTAVVPFYGHIDHRLFHDQIDFVLFPLYAKTLRKGVVTYNMPYPIFHLREGNGTRGWQVWPLVGREHKDITTTTNTDGETKVNPGHDSMFVLWPFFTTVTNGIGVDPVHEQACIPFYSLYRSKLRWSTSYSWPLGVTHTIDREKKYEEWDYPWPLIEFAHGEGKTAARVWPFYNREHNQVLVDNWYCWPVYKYNRVTSAPLDRSRTRILFFLYSYVNERNSETGHSRRRSDLFPFYTWRHEFNGRERLQVMAIMEPFFPTNKSMERDYSPLWSFWISEKNPKTGAASQSLLWNFYRRETAPHTKKISLLFGLFQYQANSTGKHWRLCYIPVGKKQPAAAEPAPRR